MPDRSRGVFRRRRQRLGALVAGWARRTPHRSPWSHQVCSLVTAALLVLATAVATLAVGPVSASAALNPVATADAINGLPDVTVHMTTALMSNGIHTGVTQTASCPTGTVEVGGGGYLRNATNPATVPNNGLALGGSNPSTGASPVDEPVANGATTLRNWMAIANFTGQTETQPNVDQAEAFALCATNGPTNIVVETTTTTGANATQQSSPPALTIASCPSGDTLIGGGAFTNTPDQINNGTTTGNGGSLKPMASYPSDASGMPATDGSTTTTSWTAYGSAGTTA